jgi:uncharacterized protein (DUF1015 family)
MAKIFPFRGVRAPRNLAGLVGSRTYKSYSQSALVDKISNNPYTFLQIIEPDYLNTADKKLKGKDKFLQIKNRFGEFKDLGYLKKEEENSMYFYEQSYGEFCFMGIIAGLSVEDYVSDTIKKHEATISEREELFGNYLNICGFNAEPVLMSYPDIDSITELVKVYMETFPNYDFNTTDRIRHRLWRISKQEDLDLIKNSFEEIDSIYIADGHHRSASSAFLHKNNLTSNTYSLESTEKFMCFLLPESQLAIYEYNRIVHFDQEIDEKTFLHQLGHYYWVTVVEKPVDILDDNCIQMLFRGTWYILRLKIDKMEFKTSVDVLDSQILTNTVLKPCFSIIDLKNDKRVEFFSGKENKDEIFTDLVTKPNSVAFFLKPVTVDQLKKVADDGLIMPPKSTFIEPKLRSGFVVYEYEK